MTVSQKKSTAVGKVLSIILLNLLMGALLAATASTAEARPAITRCDASYTPNMLTVNVQWQSDNPVVTVRIVAGAEPKEIPVSELENTQTPRGFRGEVSASIPVDNPGDAIPYVVTLEDDIRGKSEQFTGKVVIARITDIEPPPPPPPLNRGQASTSC